MRSAPDHPFGPQDDLAHLSKIYGELVLDMHSRRTGFDLATLRLGIVYGPSPVEHERPESQTVVDKFRKLAAAGAELTVDDPAATIGVVHVEDAARILLEAGPGVGERRRRNRDGGRRRRPRARRGGHRIAYLRVLLAVRLPPSGRRVPGAMKLLVTGATGFLGWRTTVLLRERGHDVVPVARPGGVVRAHALALDAVELDAGSPEIRELVEGSDAVLHFAGIPDPARARENPVRAIRENAGTTVNLLEGCAGRSAPG